MSWSVAQSLSPGVRTMASGATCDTRRKAACRCVCRPVRRRHSSSRLTQGVRDGETGRQKTTVGRGSFGGSGGILAAAVAGGGGEGGLFGPRRIKATLPTGTTLVGSLSNRLSTEGLNRACRLSDDPRPDHACRPSVAPGGRDHSGRGHSREGRRTHRRSTELTIRFREMSVGGSSYPITAEPFRLRGKDDLVESVAEIGGGAVVGGIVGAVAGIP